MEKSDSQYTGAVDPGTGKRIGGESEFIDAGGHHVDDADVVQGPSDILTQYRTTRIPAQFTDQIERNKAAGLDDRGYAIPGATLSPAAKRIVGSVTDVQSTQAMHAPPSQIALPSERIAHIAQVTHEANRAYCATLGDFSQLPWQHAPVWQKDSAVVGVRAVLDGSSAKTAEQQHEVWCEFKRADGWVYGATKNESAKTHPCLVPYAELPAAQRYKDHLFRAIVVALASDV